MKVYELKKDIREGNYDVIRDSASLERIIENINFNVQCITELNHIDYEYIATALSKSITLLANVSYILENSINDEKNINDKIKVTKKGKIKITKNGYFFDTKIIV